MVTKQPGSRMPSFWFYPWSTRLFMDLSHTLKGDWRIDIPGSLPINAFTKITVLAVSQNVKIFYNDSIVKEATVPSARVVGTAHVYVSDPWWPAARGTLNRLRIKSAEPGDSLTPENTLKGNRLLSGTYFGRIEVPLNFNLSLSIRPVDVVRESANILHFTQRNEKYSDSDSSSNMPSLEFAPASTSLNFLFGTVGSGLQRIQTPALPRESYTRVTAETSELAVNIYFNGTLVVRYELPSKRYYGMAHFYAANPWQPAAAAEIKDFSFQSIASV